MALQLLQFWPQTMAGSQALKKFKQHFVLLRLLKSQTSFRVKEALQDAKSHFLVLKLQQQFQRTGRLSSSRKHALEYEVV